MKQCVMVFLLCFVVASISLAQVKKVEFVGPDVQIIVSGSIRGTGGGNPSEEDPISGVLVWFISNGEDGSMMDARILRGTTPFKPEPDTLSFISNSNVNYVYLCAITDFIGDTNNYVSSSYDVTVNDSIYHIGFANALDLDSLVITSIGREPSGVPSLFTLKQNYPNPFNPSTTIRYELQERSNVEVFIYDEIGRLINQFSEGIKSPGSYSITWDGEDTKGKKASSGSYFYVIQAGETRQAKKMLLIK